MATMLLTFNGSCGYNQNAANCSSECVGGRHAPDQTVIPGRRIYIYVPINLNFKGSKNVF